ncbi:MAG TPA: sigma-70 family RNA polymerase sigma factor [Paracoccus sp. (in: a-proteobacteria)]|uniref:sigma-70 family RNA polymerase sigma factor n=1 Tax=Paracoccus sp. TaxID=267 RepID=UPI002C837853|nr:sigma-70 family RNA polymerase sigma factor [Paracoccus sp. (in: a-proteobacteria)]HWL58945.1 sigma-70 family RNA polymerase sigma factor [Paracoccus sp. (in: a-proteobacteria)]
MQPDPGASVFQSERPRLLRLAYRMLGSHHDAEDVVQEAWLRWQRSDQAAVREPAAWLTRIVSRLCLDQMKSARARREIYPGTWLPEPLIEPEDDALRPDNLTLTLMMALERLSPLERAAFLLHDVFGQSMEEVAGTIDRSPVATRQLAARARAHVQIDRPRYEMPRDAAENLTRAFFEACKSGDAATLGAMLAEGATFQADGGGKASSYPNVITGVDRLVRLFQGWSRKFGPRMEMVRTVTIDGLPGFISLIDGAPQTTALQIERGRITAIYITRNPDKLDGVVRH